MKTRKTCLVYMGEYQCGAVATHETVKTKIPVCDFHASVWGKLLLRD